MQPFQPSSGPPLADRNPGLGPHIGNPIPADRDAQALLHRLMHQITNSMLLVRSVVRRSAETAESLEDYVLHLETRLDSIHRVIGALVRDPDQTFTLRGLIKDELEAQGAYHGGGARLISGPRIILPATAAQTLGLVIQEMVANSFQHGVLGSEDGGQLHIGWQIDEDAAGGPELRIDWTERGQLPPPHRRGFGVTVMENLLAYQLDGRAEWDFTPRGLRIMLAVPMASLGPEPGFETADGAFPGTGAGDWSTGRF